MKTKTPPCRKAPKGKCKTVEGTGWSIYHHTDKYFCNHLIFLELRTWIATAAHSFPEWAAVVSCSAHLVLLTFCQFSKWRLSNGLSQCLPSEYVFFNFQWGQKISINTPHFRPLFLLIVEVPLWKPLIRDLFVNSQKDGCLLAFFVGYQARGLFQKRRFGLKNYNSITISISMLWNRRSRCLPSVGHLFQDHSRTIITFCLQNCFQCYEMAFFIGYQVEGCFSSIKVQKSSIRSLTSE